MSNFEKIETKFGGLDRLEFEESPKPKNTSLMLGTKKILRKYPKKENQGSRLFF